MTFKPVNAVEKDKNGKLVLNLASTAANDDWIRAVRLARSAEAGDEDAAKELKRLQETSMVQIIEEDEPAPILSANAASLMPIAPRTSLSVQKNCSLKLQYHSIQYLHFFLTQEVVTERKPPKTGLIFNSL